MVDDDINYLFKIIIIYKFYFFKKININNIL